MTVQTFPARRAEPGQTFTWHDATGVAHELTADDEGVVRPDRREASEVLDGFGLPIVPDSGPSISELRERATALGLKPRTKATRAQLLEAIAAAEAAATPTDTAPADPAKED